MEKLDLIGKEGDHKDYILFQHKNFIHKQLFKIKTKALQFLWNNVDNEI